MKKESKFIELENASRIWAVGSIHSNLESFESIKKFIITNFKKNDKLIFLGKILKINEIAIMIK